jgi:preprotein translocase subunit SecB
MKIGQAEESTLKLKNIITEKIIFKNEKLDIDFNDLGFNAEQIFLVAEEESIYKVSIAFQIRSLSSDDLYIEIVISGYFTLEDDSDIDPHLKELVLRKNTAAILFPYIRSLITNITAQAGMKPIVIPLININALIDTLKQQSGKD